MFTLMVSTVLIPMVGLAIDGGRGYLVRLKLSSAVDGGALAAARLLGTGSNARSNCLMRRPPPSSLWPRTSRQNSSAQAWSVPRTSASIPGKTTRDPCHVGNGTAVSTYKMRTVLVTATAQMPTFFMGIIGMPTVTVGVAAEWRPAAMSG